MIIKNFNKLSKNQKKKTALLILEAGLDAAKPKISIEKFVKGKIKLKQYQNVYLVAFGKAADSMTKAVDSITKIKGGIIVMPKGSRSLVTSKKFQIFKAGHPLPDQTSIRAAKTALQFVESRSKNDFIIFLVSGGSSALMSFPNGINLNEKISLTKQLLKSGATIQEINCIRKHLSKVKGGCLVQNMKCGAIALVMSDVLGDDLSSIASGMTYCDKTTFKDALKIIKKYKLGTKIPKKVQTILKNGVSKKIPETPKRSKFKHVIIANNSQCLESMKKISKKFKISTKSITISGDVKQVATNLARLAPKKKKSALIFGGEPTVIVKGKGKGGRNQELVLRLIAKLQNSKRNYIIASIGTDGIDGNTKYAGAISENIAKTSVKSYLKKNNSNSYFKKHGGLINTGYTHTNLLDVGVILI